jgi:subtilisin family serine protease
LKSAVGFDVDPDYGPVSIRPPKDQLEELNRAALRLVVVRGRINPEQVSDLLEQPGVDNVSVDARLEAFHRARTIPVDCATSGDPIGDVKRLVRKLGVDRVWRAGYDGTGVVVAVVDGGITAVGRPVSPGERAAIPRSPASGLVVGGWPDDWGTMSPGWGEHGNMMAFDVQAVAPAAALWDIRIWEGGNDFGAYVSNALAGYREAISYHSLYGQPQILSNSWGLYRRATDPSYASDPRSDFALMVEEALDEGILVLFAAGNCGESCPFSLCGPADSGPGNSILGPNGHPRVMTVGAADLEDEWCGYTSQGPAVLPPRAPKPDFCGYTRFEGYFPSADPDLRDFDGGTSAATAVAAGVVALLKQKRPELTQDEAKTVLMETAENIWSPGFDLNAGAGIIRVKAAIDLI